jgi:hypothetical protein
MSATIIDPDDGSNLERLTENLSESLREEGARQERERIVAWLRIRASAGGELVPYAMPLYEAADLLEGGAQ